MFKNNGEKALAAICIITIVLISMVLLTGIGKESSAGALEPAVQKYFERMPDDQYRMDAAELQALLGKGDIFVLDIRNASDFEKGSVKGAINIPFAQIASNLNQIPKDKLIVLYCYTGQNGGQAVATLNLLGYNARSLSGGWGGWLALTAPGGQSESAVECPT